MKGISRNASIISWIFQIISGAILGFTAWGKISGNEMSYIIFNQVDMGNTGRILIGIVEGLAAILLLTPAAPYLGAILGFSVMLGAIIAHATILGINVGGDGGMLVMMLGGVLISTLIVLVIHRKKLPFIGRICE